jgi:hypothetical protein
MPELAISPVYTSSHKVIAAARDGNRAGAQGEEERKF